MTRPTMDTDQLELTIRQRAPRIAEQIQVLADEWPGDEANFRRRVAPVIEHFAESIDLRLDVRDEYTLIKGTADAVYHRFILEYKAPGVLRQSNNARPNQAAIKQAKGYIEGLSRMERRRKERVAAAVLDGHWVIFIRSREGRWRVDPPLPVTAESMERFLRYLTSLSTELALTPDNLIRDFGENTVVSRLCVRTLYNSLVHTKNPKAQALFGQWQRQFSEVCGYEEGSTRIDLPALAKSFGVDVRQPKGFELFFAIHTYYATFIKILAVQIASYYAFPRFGTPLQAVSTYPSDKLLGYLRSMERGGIFKEALGINNFLEGDFFVWYLDLWDEEIEGALRRLITELSNYSLVTLDVDPEQTRDLLKNLYQNLMPRRLRHNLGEFYTPDWLAERLLNQLGYQGNPNKRLLDPACGSGTFLVLAIRRAREWCAEHMVHETTALEKILANIVGFDLNPLAVISARTNYLLALGDLVAHRRGEIEIPVYLADSVDTPSQGQMLETYQKVEFPTVVGRLAVPRSLVSAQYIDQLATLLEQCIEAKMSVQQFRTRLLAAFPLIEDKDAGEIAIVEELYARLKELDEQGVNGIWARIIKNAFAPLFKGRFDYVAGNPPWVNWESLPDDYRQESAPLWANYSLFPHKGYEAILGKAKDDISILMTYVAMDKYLENSGKLGFVITQSVFKTAGGGQGFRRFQLGTGPFIGVVHVDDMVEIKPFEGVGNRTSVVVLQKGERTKYPVPYTYWRKTVKGKSIVMDASLDEAMAMTARSNLVAEPVDLDNLTSPWITGRPKALKAIRKIIGPSDYTARAGVCTWLNGVFWVDVVVKRPDGLVVVANITEGAKRKVETVQMALEPDLIHPLLRGRDVQRWNAAPSAYILLTHEPGMKLTAIPEDEMKLRYHRTYTYLNRFSEELRSRSGYRRYFREEAPFYSVFDVGDYTFAPYKVVWPNIASRIDAAVVSIQEGKPIVPQHIVTLVPLANPDEAHYLCAVMNSSLANYALQSYSVRGGKSFGTPHVMENIRVPSFEPNDSIHQALADLSEQAHEIAREGDQESLGHIEAEVDKQAAKLWGLTDAELKEIQNSLRELQ